MPGPTASQFRPLSPLRNKPAPAVPQYARAESRGSTATHSDDRPRRCSSTAHLDLCRAISTAARVAIRMLTMLNYLSSKNGVISLGKLVRASRVEGCSGIADGTGFASLDPRVQLERLEHAEEDTVRTLLCAALMALVGIGAPAIAQGTIKKSKTKISVDEGKKVAVTGC